MKGDVAARLDAATFKLVALLITGGVAAAISAAMLVVVVRAQDRMLQEYSGIALGVARLETLTERESRALRGSLLADVMQLEQKKEAARREFDAQLRALEQKLASDGDAVAIIGRVAAATRDLRTESDAVFQVTPAAPPAAAEAFETRIMPRRAELDRNIALLRDKQAAVIAGTRARTHNSIVAAMAGFAGATLLAALAGVFLVLRLRQATRLARWHLSALEEANKNLDAFAGTLAHDMRNIMGPLDLALALLAQSTDPEMRQRAIERARRAYSRMSSMLDGLLAFARGAEPQLKETASVPQVIDDALEAVAPLAKEVGADIVVHAPAVDVRCSASLLSQIIVNLTTNALKHLRGRDVRRLSIEVREHDGDVDIQVSDTGPGVPSDQLSMLGRPFFKVAGDKASGSGIGLATVVRIVSAAGGAVRFDSAPGAGLRVHTTLPRA